MIEVIKKNKITYKKTVFTVWLLLCAWFDHYEPNRMDMNMNMNIGIGNIQQKKRTMKSFTIIVRFLVLSIYVHFIWARIDTQSLHSRYYMYDTLACNHSNISSWYFIFDWLANLLPFRNEANFRVSQVNGRKKNAFIPTNSIIVNVIHSLSLSMSQCFVYSTRVCACCVIEKCWCGGKIAWNEGRKERKKVKKWQKER